MEIRWDWIERHRGEIESATLGHLKLTAISLAIALALALPLALAVRGRRVASAALLSVAGILYTIPSIALFGILVPLIGLGIWPVIIGLVVYAQLTLVRNTLVGLAAVPAPVREAAEGMGLTPRQVLLRIELPLAIPAIVAGIRVTTVTAIGIATVGGLVGGGGLGQIIVDGVRRDFPTLIVVGAVCTTALAVALDLGLVLAERVSQPWLRAGRAA